MKYSQFMLVIIILLASLFSFQQSLEGEQDDKKETQTLLDVYADRMETIIDGTIKVTTILEELIILHNGSAPLDEVKRLSRVLFDEQIHINISYAPNGIIAYSYPSEGNEAAIGHMLLVDPVTKDDAKKAVETNEATLSKPYLLRQGSMAAVVRDPVYIKKNGKNEFWGFVTIAMKTSQGLMIHSDIDSLEQFNYEYHLSYKYNENSIDILQSQNFTKNTHTLSKEFTTKYGEWELLMYHTPDISEVAERIISLLLALASFSYLIIFLVLLIKRKINIRK